MLFGGGVVVVLAAFARRGGGLLFCWGGLVWGGGCCSRPPPPPWGLNKKLRVRPQFFGSFALQRSCKIWNVRVPRRAVSSCFVPRINA